jgi:tripartite-type tricarboxylate transporter receptor subunit TctC
MTSRRLHPSARLAAVTLQVLALAFVFGTPREALAQKYPAKPLRLVVPSTPGGGLDFVARQLAQGLAPRLGQPVVIENIGGASQQLGTNAVVRSAPDGYTLLYAPSAPITLAENFQPKPPYDARRDLIGVATIVRNPGLIVINSRVKANNMGEFIALAKEQPGKLFFGTPGTGHSFHLVTEMFAKQAGIQMTHVPFKGSGPAVVALLAGDIQFSVQSVEAVKEHLRSGQLRALATLESNRLESLPNVPTLSQSGLKNLDVALWHGVLAPARTPNDVVGILERELLALVKSPDFSKKLRDMNFEPLPEGSKDFTSRMAAEFELWSNAVKALGISQAR